MDIAHIPALAAAGVGAKRARSMQLHCVGRSCRGKEVAYAVGGRAARGTSKDVLGGRNEKPRSAGFPRSVT